MQIRDRVKELRRVKASELRPDPRNWRTHPQAQQDAIRGVLAEIGYADALLARELPDGSLMLVDGHLRADTTPDQVVPVLVLDVTEAEAAKILATLDPLASMAEADPAKLDALLQQVDTESEALRQMLSDLSDKIDEGTEETKLTQLEIKPPPKMTWALIGIPTVRFGEISERIENLAGVDGIILETTSNDGNAN